MLYFIYLLDTGGKPEPLYLFNQVISRFQDSEDSHLSFEKSPLEIDIFKDHLSTIIDTQPSEMMILPTCLVHIDNWPDIRNFLEDIYGVLPSYEERTTVYLSPLLFMEIRGYDEIKDDLISFLDSGKSRQIFLITDRFWNGSKAESVDWAVLFEMFLETIELIEENGGTLRRSLLDLPSISTFGCKLLEVPIRKIAKEEAFGSYRSFIQEQLHDKSTAPELDCELKVSYIENDLRKKDLDLEAKEEYNSFSGKDFEDFDFLIDKEDLEDIVSYVEERISRVLEDAFSQISCEMARLYTSWADEIFKDKITEYRGELEKNIARFFTEGTLRSLEESLEDNLDKLKGWQSNAFRTIPPPLSEDNIDINNETQSLARELQDLRRLIEIWLKNKSFKHYIKPFIAISIIVTFSFSYLAYKYPWLPFAAISIPYYVLGSSIISIVIMLLLRSFRIRRSAKDAQNKLEDIGENFRKMHKGLLKRLVDRYLGYVAAHITIKISYFLCDFLKSLRGKSKAFRNVFEKEDFVPLTASDSKITIVKEMASSLEGRLREKVREFLPEWHESIYYEFTTILSPREVEDRIVSLIIDLENEALSKLRGEFTLSESGLGDYNIPELIKGCRDVIPLPLLRDFQLIKNQQGRQRRQIEILYQPQNISISQYVPNVFYWNRSESLMVGIFYGGINPEDIQCPKEKN